MVLPDFLRLFIAFIERNHMKQKFQYDQATMDTIQQITDAVQKGL